MRKTSWRTLAAVLSLLIAAHLAAASAELFPDLAVEIERNVPARMRDGVTLRADLLRPAAGGPCPAILWRTPYGLERTWHQNPLLLRLARSGYLVVVQDVRGRYASEGRFDPYRQETADGYDSVEWAATLPGCNGKVGMVGLSYPGAVQWLAAVAAPPHLTAIAPAMCFSNGRQFFFFGGAFDLSWIGWAYRNIAPEERRRSALPGPRTAAEADEVWSRNREVWVRSQPLRELAPLKDVAPFLFEWLSHPEDGPYWDFANIESKYSQVKVPSLNISGWYDEGYGPVGAVRNFNGTRQLGSQLVLGPWTHGDPALTSVALGELDFGPNAGMDYEGLILRWCDRWLKGAGREAPSGSPVRIFVMGINQWREEKDWPLARAAPVSYYIGSNSSLVSSPPVAPQAPDRYLFDPRRPVVDPHRGALGPFDQSPLEARRDVLAYSTTSLERDLEVTGEIEAELWVSSTAPDTDFFVRLLDVHPDGKAYNLMSPTLEVQRARYRNGEGRAEFLVPGRPECLRWRSLITSNVFLKGHRIRVHVTSSLLPHLDVNPNTGRPIGADSSTRRAEQAVYHDPAHPSRVILPVIPR
ncbi:MAG: CocE/NonD family hydrolase [Acidobacteria bacterium]|nr:CocE/NonD family hydrolase [Acidobacteriota bacterium]